MNTLVSLSCHAGCGTYRSDDPSTPCPCCGCSSNVQPVTPSTPSVAGWKGIAIDEHSIRRDGAIDDGDDD